MKSVFYNIRWRNEDDKEVFNLHALESIELDFETKIVTIKCAAGRYQSPFGNYRYGGGVAHLSFTCAKPYSTEFEGIEIAIFDNGRVAVVNEAVVPSWLKAKFRTFCI